MTKNTPTEGTLTASGASYDGVTHAGIAIVAADTGHVLLAQRAMDETDAPEVQETWEFPGGGLDAPEEPLEGALREFTEEIALDLPPGEVVNGWRAGENGHYQGFVYRIEAEFPLEGFQPNDEVQAVAWVDLSDTDLPIRPEMADFDVALLDVSGNEEGQMPENDDIEPEYTPGTFDLLNPIPVHGVIAPEEMASGDRRAFSAGAMTRRPLRLPFSDQKVAIGGHDGSVVVGSVDRMMRKDGLIHWEGSLLLSAEADDLAGRMEFFDGRYGVSVDGDQGSVDAERTTETETLWFDTIRAAGLTAVAIPAFHEAYVAFGEHPEMPSDDETITASLYDEGNLIGARSTFKRGAGWVTNPKETRTLHHYWTTKGEPGYTKVGWGTPGDYRRAKALIGEKIAKNSPDKMRYLNQIIAQWHYDALGYWPGDLDKPGNKTTAQARAEREVKAGLSEDDRNEITRLLVEHEVEGVETTDDSESVWEAVLVSSAAAGGVRPPLAYFHRHESTDALVIEEPDEHGFRRTYGYAAEWGVCHVGMEGRCVEPPMTGSDDYPEFHLGRTKVATDDGTGYIHTGLLTYGVGHRDAETILSETATQQHFDNIRNAWAAVRVGEDERGIWFSGVVLPKVDADDLTLIQASGQVSGEWKYGAMRACLTVNVPGFPVVSASAEYDDEGNVLALAASAFGGVADAPCNEVSGNEDDPVGDLALAVAERIEARNRMLAMRQTEAERRFAALKQKWEN